jgi:hypothetical protein
VNIFKESTFCFIEPLYSLFGFSINFLSPDVHVFSPSAGFEFDLFLSSSLSTSLGLLLERSLFFEGTYSHKLSP